MRATTAMRLEIDERIKRDSTLESVLVKATEYFESEFQDLPSDSLWGDAVLTWIPTSGRDGYLRMVFGEVHRENGGYVDSVDFPISQFYDEISRNTWMPQLLSRVVIRK